MFGLAFGAFDDGEVHVPEEHDADPGRAVGVAVVVVDELDGAGDVVGLLLHGDEVAKFVARCVVFGGPAIFGDPDLVVANAFFFHEAANVFDVAEVVGGVVGPVGLVAGVFGVEGVGGVGCAAGVDGLGVEVLFDHAVFVAVHGAVVFFVGEGDGGVFVVGGGGCASEDVGFGGDGFDASVAFGEDFDVVTGVVGGDASAVFVGEVLFVPDFVGTDFVAVVFGECFDEVAHGYGVGGEAVGGVVEAGCFDDAEEDFDVVGGGVVDDVVEFTPGVVAGVWAFNVFPLNLLAYPVESGAVGEDEDAFAVGVVEVADDAVFEVGCFEWEGEAGFGGGGGWYGLGCHGCGGRGGAAGWCGSRGGVGGEDDGAWECGWVGGGWCATTGGEQRQEEGVECENGDGAWPWEGQLHGLISLLMFSGVCRLRLYCTRNHAGAEWR